MNITLSGGVICCPDYWTCQCEKSYVHGRKESDCVFCGASQENAMRARLDDVIEALLKPLAQLAQERGGSGVYD